MGERLLDESLDPEEVLRGTLVPVLVPERPKKMPIAVEWPDIFYKEPEQAFSFQINGVTVYRHEADLILVEPAEEGPLRFAISSTSARADFELVLFGNAGISDYSVQGSNASNVIIKYRGKSIELEEFFEQEPPTFWFADGSSLVGVEYVALRNQPEPFTKERIEVWDWTGSSIRVESQGVERNPKAIQYRVIAEMKKRGFSVVFDDDDHGESADVVGILERDDYLEVEFWHCKYALADKACGQAQKSIRWLEKSRDLFTHLMRREPRRYKGKEATRYEVGSKKDLLRIREKADRQQVRLRVVVVQPGLSKASVSQEQLELLAVTENYLLETFAVPFGVVGSS